MFFYEHEQFLESDGRHHIWIGTPDNEGTLVYDQHNVIFAYGDLTDYEAALHEREFRRQEFKFPFPHCHNYPSDNVKDEENLLAHFAWQYSPLQKDDDYD